MRIFAGPLLGLLARPRGLCAVLMCMTWFAGSDRMRAQNAAPAPEDPRVAALQAALADSQKLMFADQETIAQLKNQVAAAQAAVEKAQTNQRGLLESNEKLSAEVVEWKAKAKVGGAAPGAAPVDPRVTQHQQDNSVALMAAQRQIEGDRTTIKQLQAQLAASQSGAVESPAQKERDALVGELQTALAAAQQASRTDRDALARAQADLAAARSAQAQVDTQAAALAAAKGDLASAVAAAAQARAVATAATERAEHLAAELASARTEAERTAAALRQAQDRLAAYDGTPDVAHQLADEHGRVELFKRRSADLSIQVDQLTAENAALMAVAGPAPGSVPAAVGAAPRSHRVEAGDTLTKLSVLYYGTPARWRDIYAANRDLLGVPAGLAVGQVLKIP